MGGGTGGFGAGPPWTVRRPISWVRAPARGRVLSTRPCGFGLSARQLAASPAAPRLRGSGVELGVEQRVQQQAVADRPEQRGDRLRRGAGEHRAALLVGADDLDHQLPVLAEQRAQPLAERRVALGLAHRLEHQPREQRVDRVAVADLGVDQRRSGPRPTSAPRTGRSGSPARRRAAPPRSAAPACRGSGS